MRCLSTTSATIRCGNFRTTVWRKLVLATRTGVVTLFQHFPWDFGGCVLNQIQLRIESRLQHSGKSVPWQNVIGKSACCDLDPASVASLAHERTSCQILYTGAYLVDVSMQVLLSDRNEDRVLHHFTQRGLRVHQAFLSV